MEREKLASAAGSGFNGADVTGGQGSPNPPTTANPGGSTTQKSLLGG